jgi:cytochrome c2
MDLKNFVFMQLTIKVCKSIYKSKNLYRSGQICTAEGVEENIKLKFKNTRKFSPMREPTLALIIGIAVVVIATVIALQQISTPPQAPAQTTPAQTTTPTTQTGPSTGTAPTTGIKYDPQLAEKGKRYYSEIGCTACHSIKSLGISGGAVGPDLSKTLLGNPGAGGSKIGRFFKEKGLEDPAADPEKAAELVKEYLIDPPPYSTTMRTQVRAYKATYSDWDTDQVPALVELLKEAAAKASG